MIVKSTGLFAASLLLSMMMSAAMGGEDQWGPPFWTPSRALIKQVERQIRQREQHLQMPHPAPDERPRAISKYSRYYGGVTFHGHRAIVSEMLLPDDLIWPRSSLGAHIVSPDDLPVAGDGGCDILWLLYDVESDRILWIVCNPIR